MKEARFTGLSKTLVQGTGVLAIAACSPVRAPRPHGPAPVYERPMLAPWDAGVAPNAENPFGAAAESGWLDETSKDSATGDAGKDESSSPSTAATDRHDTGAADAPAD